MLDALQRAENKGIEMEKYIRVYWPESQEWADKPGVICAWDHDWNYCFVPEELYDKANGLVPTKRKDLFLKPVDNE